MTTSYTIKKASTTDTQQANNGKLAGLMSKFFIFDTQCNSGSEKLLAATQKEADGLALKLIDEYFQKLFAALPIAEANTLKTRVLAGARDQIKLQATLELVKADEPTKLKWVCERVYRVANTILNSCANEDQSISEAMQTHGKGKECLDDLAAFYCAHVFRHSSASQQP